MFLLELESLFNKVAGLKACNFIKKRVQHRCFPFKFEKFLRTPFSQNTHGGCFWRFSLHFGIRVTVFEFHCSLKMLNMHFITFSFLSFKYCLIFFCWDIHHCVLLTIQIFREHACLVYHFQPGLFFNQSHDYFQLVYMGWKFQLVFSNRGEISARFTVMKFLHIIVILFLLFSPIMQDEIS